MLESEEGGAAVARVESSEREAGELPFRMELLVGLPDPAQAESIVEFATALGAVRIAFVAANRVGPGRLSPARLERLHRIAASAVKQARRTRFPSIDSIETLEGALGALGPASWRMLAHPAGQARLPDQNLGAQPIIQIAVGPPGGFLEAEVARIEAAGFLGISLGPSRLTTFTASLSILAWTRNSLLSMGLA